MSLQGTELNLTYEASSLRLHKELCGSTRAVDAALGRDRQVYRLLGQEEKSENKLGSPEPGPQGQNPLDSARHMSHLPVRYRLNDNEDTQFSGVLEDSCSWQRDQFLCWDLRRTCLNGACLVSLSNSKPMVTCHLQACNQ